MNESQTAGSHRTLAPLSRRARKKERTRSDIYNAAMNLFLRRGFDAITIDDICRVADVARATFFLHFPAKEVLLVEYGDRANRDLAVAIKQHRGSAASTLKMSLKMLAERTLKHPDVVRMVVLEIIGRPRLISEHDERAADLIHLLATVIRRGQTAGEFRKRVDPTLAALTACSAWFGLVYTWARHDSKIDIEAAIAESLDIILHGLSDRKARRV
ncbi:MAG: kstR [Candidatus Binatus sp.]|nr:kstR [Candidatus Binatus sp.]